MLTKFLISCKQLYSVFAAQNSSVISLTEDNFHQSIAKGYVFVKFFVPWCEHCQKLAPKWVALSEMLSNVKNFKMAEVDCSESPALYDEIELTSFPTLILFQDGHKLAEHKGPKELDSIYSFVKKYVKINQ
ncbi:thioredoxin domain-containing protein 5-like [Gigantopelta aegis]|uniref:thioredoxin domain-containing protein 5-like n=1 Tax=Gigantopelta aegis TaxID=1735272 RepID=UPI001B8890C5|nr:thioredoxin domain-containing protein 5-like [Gigantopelta aegis]